MQCAPDIIFPPIDDNLQNNSIYFVMLVEDSSVESFNIRVAQNNISLKKPKSLGSIQSDILDTEPNYCS